MSENNAGTEGTEGTEGTGAEGTESTAGEGSESTDPPAEPQSVEELPQWAQTQLTKARNEAATYRQRAKDAADNAKAETSGEFAERLQTVSDEKATAVAELETARTDNLKLRAALKAEIPGESAIEFAELLKGSTEEEITAHAEKVKTLFGVSKSAPATDPRQGGVGDAKPEVKPGLGRLQYAYSTQG